MQFGERKFIFIKDNIPRDVNSARGHIKALKTFVMRTVTKKDTLFGMRGKFPLIIGMEIWPTSTPKNLEEGIIRSLFIEALEWSHKLKELARCSVYEIGSRNKSLISEFKGHGCLSKKG
jgi:hypothetical protein